MKRKIVGIFMIALLTISCVPIVSGEATQVPESYESKGGDIKFFFIGFINGFGCDVTYVKQFLALFGVYKDYRWIHINVFDVIGNNFILVDGKIKHLESPYFIILNNFSGIGTPFGFVTLITDGINIPVFFTGSCESYHIQNVTRI